MRIERQKFSKGENASVYRTSAWDNLRFPQADLRRHATVDDPHWFQRHFYYLKIAHLLFPEHIIDVTGVTGSPKEEVSYTDIHNPPHRIHTKRSYNLYSKEANVPSEHAIFSRNVTKKLSEEGGVTIIFQATKDRNIAIKHNAKYHTGATYLKALEIAAKMSTVGIDVPCDDPTDYCISDSGDVVFFEVDGFNTKQVMNYLESRSNPMSHEKRALHLLKRASELHLRSRELSRQNLSAGVTGF